MKVLLTAGLLAIPLSSWALDASVGGFYAGAGATQINYNASGDGNEETNRLTSEPDWTGVELLGGYKHSPFVGVEARLGVASSSPDMMYSSIYYRTESANDTAKTYLLLGYSAAEIDTPSGDVSLSGLSYGGGVGFPIGHNLNLNLKYRMLVSDSDADARMGAFAVNLDYRFSGSNINSSGGASSFVAENAGFYAGLGVAQIKLSEEDDYEEDEYDDEEYEDDEAPKLKWNAVELIGGYRHNSLATFEARFGASDKEELLSFTYASLYYRPCFSVSKAQIYGLIGYSSVDMKFEDEPDEETGEVDKESFSFSSMSYGAGVNFPVNDHFNIGLEYRLLMTDEEEGQKMDLTAMAANVNYRF